MRDQFQLWLIPPLFTAILSIWFRRRLTLEFGWSLLVQAILIVIAASTGLIVGPKPIWALITWLLFAAFMVFPTLYLRHCEHLFSTLNASSLARAAKKIPFFYWGKLGQFWQDTYLSYSFYIRREEESGDRLLNYWKTQKLPPFFEENLDATRLAADGLLWHWDAIIQEFERRRSNPDLISASMCLQASRAYAETGNVAMATQCLMSANLPNQRMDQRHLGLVFLQFFCLVGSEEHAKQIIQDLTKGATPSMILILNIWLSRCFISNNKMPEAIAMLDKLLMQAKTLSDKTFDAQPWILRIESYLEIARSSDTNSVQILTDTHNNARDIELIWSIYKNARNIQHIVLPRRSSGVVNVLLTIMCCAYIFSGCIDLIDNPFVLGLIGPNSQLVSIATNQGELMFRHFYLEKNMVYAGQYYRLVTYLFLHGNFSHLVLNAFGLIWFGRIANSIYGPWKFLLIFLVAGAFGGLAQISFSDTSAVGASGSIFGIFAAVAVGIFKLRDLLPAQMRRRELRWMTVMTVCQIGLDRVIPGVAGLAHIGGLVAGFGLGVILFPKQVFEIQKKRGD